MFRHAWLQAFSLQIFSQEAPGPRSLTPHPHEENFGQLHEVEADVEVHGDHQQNQQNEEPVESRSPSPPFVPIYRTTGPYTSDSVTDNDGEAPPRVVVTGTAAANGSPPAPQGMATKNLGGDFASWKIA